MSSLSEKVAIVTGGSRGIGAAISKRLSRDGAKLLINFGANDAAAESVKKDIEANGGEVYLMKGDVSNPHIIKELFDAATARFGGFHILINNAGISGHQPLGEIGVEFCDRLFAINLRAVLLTINEAARRMTEGGRIINISSIAARSALPGGAAYAATKAGVEAITRVAAAELGPRGITVNAVAPGATETDMLRRFFEEDKGEKTKMLQSTPLGRLGQPEDIADVVAFLASEDSRWITGQVIAASGGR